MTAPKKKRKSPVAPRARSGRGRQRQRLIEACISALHLHGPSRTTVEKVVAIAKMSPGIVRFYFDSKAAMLIASLQFLAAEFEEKVLLPVAKLKATPTRALQSLVELYLDPEIASTRKVSVWYAFWGEASSRQEYYDICGQQDENFALLVRELIEALIAETSQVQLDADAIALGLIGALEILWQEIAFQTDRDVDRSGYRRRGMAFLSSIFPGSFGVGDRPLVAPALHARYWAGWAYCDARIFAMERDVLFRGGWMVVGHESEVPRKGDYLTLDTGVERVLVVRGGDGALHGLRNSCPQAPHAVIVDRCGRFEQSIECKQHARSFALDGSGTGMPGALGLTALDLSTAGGLIFVKSPAAGRDRPQLVGGDLDLPDDATRIGSPLEVAIAADWKVVIELWLEAVPPEARLEMRSGAAHALHWSEPALRNGGWSAHRYQRLLACLPTAVWQRRFLPPNQLIERRADGLSVLQALPTAPGYCVLRRLDYTILAPEDTARAAQYLARRIGAHTRRATVAMAESIQKGRLQFGYEHAAGGIPLPGIAWFREHAAARVPALAAHRPPR